MSSKLRIGLIVALVAFGLTMVAATAEAAPIVIDLDSTNPANLETVNLGAGTWNFKAVSGGAFGDAWNPWGITTVPNPPGKVAFGGDAMGWLTWWSYSLDGGATWASAFNAYVYSTAAIAVADAPTYSIHLDSPQAVQFRLIDTYWLDNAGGIRLRGEVETSSVPTPAAAGLFAFAAIAVEALRRSRRS